MVIWAMKALRNYMDMNFWHTTCQNSKLLCVVMLGLIFSMFLYFFFFFALSSKPTNRLELRNTSIAYQRILLCILYKKRRLIVWKICTYFLRYKWQNRGRFTREFWMMCCCLVYIMFTAQSKVQRIHWLVVEHTRTTYVHVQLDVVLVGF